MKAAVTSETQLASSDLATVAECIAYLRDRVPWPADEIFNFQQKRGERGGFTIPTCTTGWWFGTCLIVPIYWKCHHPN